MLAYQPFLIPLVGNTIPNPSSGAVTNPLQEEMWLVQHMSEMLQWHQVGKQVQQAYGMKFIHELKEIDLTDCDFKHSPGPGCYAYILCNGRSRGFAMEHPSQLADFDKLAGPGIEPLLVRASIFSSIISRLMQGPGESHSILPGREASTIAFQNELRDLVAELPSDWHLEPDGDGYRSRIRKNGLIGPVHRITRTKGNWYVNSLKRACRLDGDQSTKALDGSFKFKGTSAGEVSIRVSMIPSIHGLSVVARFLYSRAERLDTLGMLGMGLQQENSILKTWTDREGLFLVCGPTGSGKSTTLHTLLRVAARQNEKVLSAEDPVERILPGIQQVQVQGGAFSEALKAFMRQSPDTIMIGEIRDQATAETTIQSVYSGHRILATIHARSTASVFNRFADFGIHPESFSEITGALIHQRLLPLLCGECRIALRKDSEFTAGIHNLAGLRHAVVYGAGAGCSQCHQGYSGRTAIFAIESINRRGYSYSTLEKEALKLLAMGKTDQKSILCHLNLSNRMYFSFPNCKDFAN